MTQRLKNYKRIIATSVIAATLAVGVAVPALAASDSVTAQVTPGTRSASLSASPAFSSTVYGFADVLKTSTASVTLSAADSTGAQLGWNVTMQATDFAGTGTNTAVIPALGFKVASVGSITSVAGDPVSAVAGQGPEAGGGVGSGLDLARKVLVAGATYGDGEYTAALAFNLNIPKQTPVDTYTSTLTTTIASAP